MFLLGDEGFTFHVQSLYSTQVDKQLEKLCEELMMFHWAKSGKVRLAYEILQMGSITGDAWMGVQWDEEEEFCKVSIYDSRQCFPRFVGGDYNNMESFLVRQSIDKTPSQDFRLMVTKFTKDSVETWKQKDVSIDESKITKFDQSVQENPYGFIPVVHVKNRPNSASYYGKSDANDILKINKVYNEMNQQVKAIIDYHATPTTVITGASAKSLKRGLGQIWSGLPPEANVFNLALDVDLSATTNFISSLKTAMHELSDVPENSLGKIQAISNTSAAALQITYHPLLQQANLKATAYGEGISQINMMILKILDIMEPKNPRLKEIKKLNRKFTKEMNIIPVFAYGFPKDRMDELNKAEKELQLKLDSRRGIMEKMGKQNIPQLLEEIDQDQIDQALLQVKINDLVVGGGGEEQPSPEEEEQVEE
jgi:hypothetical protein